MSRVFEYLIDQLCEKTGYDYDFLVEKYNEVMDDTNDYKYFERVTLEKGW